MSAALFANDDVAVLEATSPSVVSHIYREGSRRRRVACRGGDSALVIIVRQISVAFDEERVSAECLGDVEVHLERTKASVIVEPEDIPVLHLAVVLDERRISGRWETVRCEGMRERWEAVATKLAGVEVDRARLKHRLGGEAAEGRQISLGLSVL